MLTSHLLIVSFYGQKLGFSLEIINFTKRWTFYKFYNYNQISFDNSWNRSGQEEVPFLSSFSRRRRASASSDQGLGKRAGSPSEYTDVIPYMEQYRQKSLESILHDPLQKLR